MGGGSGRPMEFKLDIKIKSIEKMLLPLMKQASTYISVRLVIANDGRNLIRVGEGSEKCQKTFV